METPLDDLCGGDLEDKSSKKARQTASEKAPDREGEAGSEPSVGNCIFNNDFSRCYCYFTI